MGFFFFSHRSKFYFLICWASGFIEAWSRVFKKPFYINLTTYFLFWKRISNLMPRVLLFWDPYQATQTGPWILINMYGREASLKKK